MITRISLLTTGRDSSRRMIKISKIWFEGDYIYGLADDGKTYHQSLCWYPRLKKASQEEKNQYIFSTIGIHWRNIGEDISFESIANEETSLPPNPQTTKLLYAI